MNRLLNRFSFLLAVFFAAVLTAGCGIFSSRYPVTVVFPKFNFTGSGIDEPEVWTISWLSGDGVCRRTVSSSDSVTLSLPKERPILVSAQPESERYPMLWRIKPAGAVAAISELSAEEIQLTWEDGFSAWYLLNLAEAGINPESINIGRFRDAVGERGENRPWDIDQRKLGGNLADGSLWIYSFRLSSLVEAAIPLPHGTWYSEYLPSEPLEAGADGWNGDIGVGTHAFLCTENGSAAFIEVGGSGEVTLLIEGP